MIFGYFLLINLIYFLTSVLSYRTLTKYIRQLRSIDFDELMGRAGAPPISILVPAFNEENTCVESIRSLLELQYSKYQILVINDGSSDKTMDKLIDAYDMVKTFTIPSGDLKTESVRGIYYSSRYDNLWLIDKENGGKADALNTGINYAKYNFFCALDADSVLEKDALIRIVRPFLEDGRTVASGGILRIINGSVMKDGALQEIRMPSNWLARFQILEYLRAFLSARLGWSVLNSSLIISGAFGLFRRNIVLKAGGYCNDTVGEDMELVVRLHRYCRENEIDYRISFVPDPVAWTECPETFSSLAKQRDRWQRGLVDSLSRHRKMLFNPKFGIVGMLGFPFFYFLEMLGPIVELGGYLVFLILVFTGKASFYFALSFFMVAVILGVSISLMSVVMEELTFRRYKRPGDLIRLFLIAVLENVGYRQFNTICRFKGVLTSMARKKSWEKFERKGFVEEIDHE